MKEKTSKNKHRNRFGNLPDLHVICGMAVPMETANATPDPALFYEFFVGNRFNCKARIRHSIISTHFILFHFVHCFSTFFFVCLDSIINFCCQPPHEIPIMVWPRAKYAAEHTIDAGNIQIVELELILKRSKSSSPSCVCGATKLQI